MPDHVEQETLEVHKLSVVWVIPPSRDLNSISGLSAEIFFDVVNDDRPGQVSSANSAQVLNVVLGGVGLRVLHLNRVLAVEPVRDGPCLVQSVQNLIRVLAIYETLKRSS